MLYYLRSTFGADHPEWQNSTLGSDVPLLVSASDEAGARIYADIHFRDITADNSPYTNSSLVNCAAFTGVTSPLAAQEWREGLIAIPQNKMPSGFRTFGHLMVDEWALDDDWFGETDVESEWWVVNEEKGKPASVEGRGDLTLPSLRMGARRAAGTSTLEGGGASTAQAVGTAGGSDRDREHVLSAEAGQLDFTGSDVEMSVSAPITQQMVTRAIQNRAVLQFQASTLGDLLNDLVGPEGVSPEQRNMSLGDALGISEALTEGQLLEVLRSLRDELRRFNDALQQGTTDPDGLERLQDIGLNALNTFAQTVAVGSGAIVVVSIGNVLDQAGLVPWDRILEGIKALKPGG